MLIAIQPGDSTQSKLLRPLVYLWIGQNVMLVLSSMLRLKLYVEIYLLTYWRVTAGIWMGLVAIGLVLIVIRIAQNRSHRWLIRMNLIALLATLYVCSLIDFDAMIASYNVAHSRAAGGGITLIPTDSGVRFELHFTAAAPSLPYRTTSDHPPITAHIHGCHHDEPSRDNSTSVS